MGYYTNFHIKAVNLGIEEAKRVSHTIHNLCYCDVTFEEFTKRLSGLDVEDILNVDLDFDSLKWYEAENDMSEIAKNYPHSVFKLYGRGEDGEQWKATFVGDRSCFSEGKITYEPLSAEVEEAIKKITGK